MKERLFFFVPEADAAKRVIENIEKFGIDEADLHVIARDDVKMEPLPEPDLQHRSDVVDAAKRGAVTGGTIGLIGSVVAVTLPAAGLTLGGGAILAGTALGTALGTWFSTLVGVSVPNQDVDEYRNRIERGELMIIVDCEGETLKRLQSLMRERHGEIVLLQGNLDAA
jgi:hypothetical protein